MIQLAIYYLLVGTIVGFCLEGITRATGQNLNGAERFWLIVLWPIMLVTFIFNVIVGFFKGKDDE